MKLSRLSRFVAALITVLSLLFSQLAVAAYVCPGGAPAQVTAMSAMGDMADCPEMGKQASSLCQAHCAVDHQSMDKPATPYVAPFIAAELSIVVRLVDATPPVQAVLLDTPLLTRSTAPPLIIRNCCFRI